MEPRQYRVKELAELSGVSVRTLHHYDSIGLLVPSGRSAAGYRLYSESDLLRLQQVLVQRELGFSLGAIRELLDDPHFDYGRALREQRRVLLARALHTQRMLGAIERALKVLDATDSQGESDMQQDMRALFDGFDPADYEQEASDRWGNTEAYRQARRRAQSYTEEDWARYKVEVSSLLGELAAALLAGKAPDDASVLELAEQHRQHIERWFYPCSKSLHVGLADLYQADPRFTQNIDKYGAGLSDYLASAIRANAQR